MTIRIAVPDGSKVVIKAKKAAVSIRTGETNGHTHAANIDDQTGDGSTSRNAGHTHAVRDFRVQAGGGDDHRHSLRKPATAAKVTNKQLVEDASYIPLLPVEKKDEDKQIVLGVVLEPGTKRDGTVDDSHGSVISDDEIERAAHLWLARFQNRGLQHKTIVNSKVEIYESYIAPVNMTIGGRKIKKGTWLLMYHILDSALWEKVKKGEITGLSMGGFAKKRPVGSKKKGKGVNKFVPRKVTL